MILRILTFLSFGLAEANSMFLLLVLTRIHEDAKPRPLRSANVAHPVGCKFCTPVAFKNVGITSRSLDSNVSRKRSASNTRLDRDLVKSILHHSTGFEYLMEWWRSVERSMIPRESLQIDISFESDRRDPFFIGRRCIPMNYSGNSRWRGLFRHFEHADKTLVSQASEIH